MEDYDDFELELGEILEILGYLLKEHSLTLRSLAKSDMAEPTPICDEWSAPEMYTARDNNLRIATNLFKLTQHTTVK